MQASCVRGLNYAINTFLQLVTLSGKEGIQQIQVKIKLVPVTLIPVFPAPAVKLHILLEHRSIMLFIPK